MSSCPPCPLLSIESTYNSILESKDQEIAHLKTLLARTTGFYDNQCDARMRAKIAECNALVQAKVAELNLSFETQQRTLESKQQAFVQLIEQTQKQNDEIIVSLERCQQERNQTITTLHQQLTAQREELKVYKTIRDRQQIDLNHTITDLTQAIEILRGKLNERDRTIVDLTHQVETQKIHVDNLIGKLKESKQTVDLKPIMTTDTGETTDHNSSIQNPQDMSKENLSDVQALHGQLDSSQETIRNLQQKLNTCNTHRHRRTLDLQWKNANLLDLNQQIIKEKQNTLELTRTLLGLKKTCETREKQFVALQKENETIRLKLNGCNR